MRTMDFNRVASSAPLDRSASVIRDGSGDLWDGKVPAWHAHWDAPPLAEKEKPEQAQDLRGRVFGRLTVIRYHRSHHKRGAQWLVRCSCGGYELRRTHVIVRAAPNAMCQKCNWLLHIVQARSAKSTPASREQDALLLDSIARGEAA